MRLPPPLPPLSQLPAGRGLDWSRAGHQGAHGMSGACRWRLQGCQDCDRPCRLQLTLLGPRTAAALQRAASRRRRPRRRVSTCVTLARRETMPRTTPRRCRHALGTPACVWLAGCERAGPHLPRTPSSCQPDLLSALRLCILQAGGGGGRQCRPRWRRRLPAGGHLCAAAAARGLAGRRGPAWRRGEPAPLALGGGACRSRACVLTTRPHATQQLACALLWPMYARPPPTTHRALLDTASLSRALHMLALATTRATPCRPAGGRHHALHPARPGRRLPRLLERGRQRCVQRSSIGGAATQCLLLSGCWDVTGQRGWPARCRSLIRCPTAIARTSAVLEQAVCRRSGASEARSFALPAPGGAAATGAAGWRRSLARWRRAPPCCRCVALGV